jgi:hypothetical protein
VTCCSAGFCDGTSSDLPSHLSNNQLHSKPKHTPNHLASSTPQAERHLLVRTIALGNLPAGPAAAAAVAAARAAGAVEAVADPAPDAELARAHLAADGCSGHVIFVQYPSAKEANAAVALLHGKPLSELMAAAAAATDGGAAGKKARAGGKKGGGKKGAAAEAEAAAEAAAAFEGTLWARVVAGEGAQVKKWRIILRNLAFQVGGLSGGWVDGSLFREAASSLGPLPHPLSTNTFLSQTPLTPPRLPHRPAPKPPPQTTEADIRKLLAPAGFVWSVDLPRGPDGRARGFAFAAFTGPQDAARAIALANGAQLRKRPVAADWAVGKKQYESAAAAAAGGAGGKAGGDDDDEVESASEVGSEDEMESGSEGGSDDEEEGSDEEGSEEEEEDELREEHGMVSGVLGRLLASDEKAAKKEAKAAGKAAAEKDKAKKEKAGKEDKAKQEQDKAAAAAAARKGKGEEEAEEGGEAVVQREGAISGTVFARGLALDTTAQELQVRVGELGVLGWMTGSVCVLVLSVS